MMQPAIRTLRVESGTALRVGDGAVSINVIVDRHGMSRAMGMYGMTKASF